MEQREQRWSTWVVVVAILILAVPVIWALSIILDIVAALSIGGILVIAAIIGVFIWLNARVHKDEA